MERMLSVVQALVVLAHLLRLISGGAAALDLYRPTYELESRRPDINQEVQACGRRLNDILRLVCVGPLSKRNAASSTDILSSGSDWQFNEIDANPLGRRLFPRQSLGEALARRRKRQIVKECCYEPCTLKHIRDNYCD